MAVPTESQASEAAPLRPGEEAWWQLNPWARGLGLVSIALLGGLCWWAGGFPRVEGAAVVWFAAAICLFAYGQTTGVLPVATVIATIGALLGVDGDDRTKMISYAVFAIWWTMAITTLHLAMQFRRRPKVDARIMAVRLGAVGLVGVIGGVVVFVAILFTTDGLPADFSGLDGLTTASIAGLMAVIFLARLVVRRWVLVPPTESAS